ncbi:hypothetical protein BO1005MUT1_30043 [Hyphomicrobiales bacterium]|nr:hypothetical protein BO1005MUT1_30043 [Hyphomicrobiales bacterium]
MARRSRSSRPSTGTSPTTSVRSGPSAGTARSSGKTGPKPSFSGVAPRRPENLTTVHSPGLHEMVGASPTMTPALKQKSSGIHVPSRSRRPRQVLWRGGCR